MSVDLSRIVGPSNAHGSAGDPRTCWADRRNRDGRVLGSCIERGEIGLLGLCSTHYGEIVGWPA